VNEAQENTDKEIWRERPGDYYSPSLHVTEDGCGIGIHAGGVVVVKTPKEWIKLTKARREAFEEAAAIADEYAQQNHKSAVESIKRGDDIGHDVLQACEHEAQALAERIRALANKEPNDD
jgi:hypothetical protein